MQALYRRFATEGEGRNSQNVATASNPIQGQKALPFHSLVGVASQSGQDQDTLPVPSVQGET